MRRIAIIGSAAVLLLLAGAVYFVNSGLPAVARTQAIDILAAAGFKTVTMPEPQIRLGAVRYDRISLDPDDISTIQRLEVRYNPFKLLFTRSLQSIYIDGLNLTGEMAADGTVTLSGWENPGNLSGLRSHPLQLLTIESGKISLMTKTFGGISIDYDFQARRHKREIEMRATAKSGQKHLNFSSNLTGTVNDRGIWQASAELEQAKFEIAPVKASRVNGNVDFSVTPQGSSVLGDLNAGGLTLYNFPWQNATATVEKQNGTTKIFADMKSVGIDGIELSLSYENQPVDEAPLISGTLHAENLSQILQYLKGLGMAAPTDQALAILEKLRDVGIEFSVLPSSADVKLIDYTINANDAQLPVTGRLQVNRDGSYESIISGQPFFLQDFDKFIYGENVDSGRFSGGHITLSGNFSKKDKVLVNTMKMEISEGIFSFGPLPLQGLTGPVVIENLLSMTTKEPQLLSCRLPVKKSITQKCSVNIDIKDGKIQIHELEAELFSGTVTAKNFDFGSLLNLDAKNIDLWDFTNALGIEGLTATGRANATIPLALENGKLSFKNAKITSAGTGVARYAYKTAPSFFKGDEFEQEALKQALENYHYVSFEIRIDGAAEEPDIMIIANGHNPEMLEQRPVSLHLKTRAPLAPLLKNIVAD